MLTGCHLSRLIEKQAQLYGKRDVLFSRDDVTGRWQGVSWLDFAGFTRQVARALLALGVRVQENVAVFAPNMAECLYVDFGCYGVRAVTIPFYPTSSTAQVQFMVDDAGVRYLFVGSQLQYDVAFPLFATSESLERMIIFDRAVVRHAADTVSMYFDDFLKLGNESYEAAFRQRLDEASPEDIANILYTSGTTGVSKGVILTHGMYMNAMVENDKVLPVTEKDVVLNFLPFSHVFERGWSYLCLSEGAQLYINLRPTEVVHAMKEIRPTCMCAVPRFWEKVYETVMERVSSMSETKRKMVHSAIEIGKQYRIEYLASGRQAPMWLKMKYKFMDKAVLSTLREQLGLTRANIFPTAGAAIAGEVETFVHACGIGMITGYGLTESTATVTCARVGEPFSIGSVGRVIGGVEIKVAEDGEILLRGKSITPGYYRNVRATREVIDDEGWFHTGDSGYVKNGELFLTDRIKDLYKTSNGKYIAPQQIESKLIVDRYIDQIVVVADRQKFVSALIVPSYTALETLANSRGISYGSRSDLCENPAIIQFIMERIDTLQQTFAHYEQVKRITLLPEPFSMSRNELTNTLKVKRKVIFEHYRKEIETMYR
ncbi:MAG: long-chain fatty acid--CoA ligase [Bacteroidaceae bacterium]|nr:long-chain fatty acid--CoA ligase [Bacteroidaceae bacterium]